AAFVIEARKSGRAGVRALVSRARLRRTSRAGLVAAIGIPPLMTAAALAIARGGTKIEFDAAFAVGQVWVVAGEELGWRGWLWPLLASRLGPDWGTAAVTA